MSNRFLPFVDGRSQSLTGGRTVQLHNPATGETLVEVEEGGAAAVAAAVDAASKAWTSGVWSRVSSSQRVAVLLRIAALLRERSEEIALWETRNAGKPIGDSRWEVGAAARCFEYYAGLIPAIGGETLPVAANGTGFTWREPIGVCGLIVPWNFPLLITAWKAAPALAAGCTAVVKPAPATPITALLLASIAQEAGLPDGVLNVVPGGDDAGEALVAHPAVRKISFTGSTSAGKAVLRAGSDDLKRVSLELGGKSPTVVFADADLAKAAGSGMSVFGNAGQDCCARSRILVERSVYADFVDAFVAGAKAAKIGDPEDETVEIGSLISRAHRSHVDRFVQSAKADGAQIVCGGGAPDGANPHGAFYAPTVITGATSGMEIFRDEVFGPVAAIVPFDSEEEAVALANDSSYGLSGSVWTRDIGRALRVAKAVETGVLSINTSSSVHQEMPFGGRKHSGIGRDLGKTALDQYTEWKSVFIAAE